MRQGRRRRRRVLVAPLGLPRPVAPEGATLRALAEGCLRSRGGTQTVETDWSFAQSAIGTPRLAPSSERRRTADVPQRPRLHIARVLRAERRPREAAKPVPGPPDATGTGLVSLTE